MSVIDKKGNQVEFDGANKSKMVGFFKHLATKDRIEVLNKPGINPYLSPVGKTNITNYENRGYVLKQTEGWGMN